VGSPILEFLHLFLGGIFHMVADPTITIRQSALAFLQSVLPKLLVVNHSMAVVDADERPDAVDTKDRNAPTGQSKLGGPGRVDFDKILQSLVTVMEHPDPFVRKVAMFWMSKIVKSHLSSQSSRGTETVGSTDRNAAIETVNSGLHRADSTIPSVVTTLAVGSAEEKKESTVVALSARAQMSSAASISVRNSLPHILPGILLRYVRAYRPLLRRLLFSRFSSPF
jgi:hypothetical protein